MAYQTLKMKEELEKEVETLLENYFQEEKEDMQRRLKRIERNRNRAMVKRDAVGTLSREKSKQGTVG